MISWLQSVVGATLHRLSDEVRTDAPNILAAVAILFGALMAARLARWLVARALRQVDLNSRVRQSGISEALCSRETLNAFRIATQGVYWAVVIVGAVLALRVVGAQVTSGIVDGMISLAPRLAGGGAIVVGGMWLGLYLSRSMLIWAVNEDLPAPRKLAVAVRVLVVFAAVAVAGDVMNLGGGLFRAVFIVVLGGVVLSASLAVGLGSRDVVRRYLEERMERAHMRNAECADERELWNHL